MSADTPATPPVERVTLDDIRHRAEAVKRQAVSEARKTVDDAIGPDNVRTLVIVAGLVLVAASLAFYLGSRSGKAAMADKMLAP
jgi:hypothetical protein